MRIFVRIAIGLCGFLCFESVWATCRWHEDGAPRGYNSVTVPAQLTMSAAPIGGTLASFDSNKIPIVGSVWCAKGDVLQAALDIKGLEPSGIPNVYQTGVEGVGIRISGMIRNDVRWLPPQNTTIDNDIYAYHPHSQYIRVEYIRTGVAVGGGEVPSAFVVKHIIPGVSPITFESTTPTTKLVNNIYFTSCESQNKTLNIAMGKQHASHIRANNAAEKAFSFMVRCQGLKPKNPAPVKIYFEGDAPADGQLNISQAGHPGVASGVHISLTTSDGIKLPFAKANAIDLRWLRSETTAEVYEFSGVARYANSNNGDIKPGRADATMTYVLDYN